MNPEHVFVYGTLRRGGSNHFRMNGADFIGSGRVAGKIHKIDWYPALVCGGDQSVRGELYRIKSTAHLKALDDFEGITSDAEEPREYRRIKVETMLDSGAIQEAWVWEWIGDLCDSTPLEGDDWLDYEPNPS
ncbi:gamma-glutamylcyclotransferase [Luteolibacter algae]|uniref:Gamma-glutamylcyclotransferase family protein n=1 Tax=Luteolibacter algae TaxID=454151 RepID=A0ABW5D4K6_9BACT